MLMIQMTTLLMRTDSSTNGREPEMLPNLDLLVMMTGTLMLALMLHKRLETMLLHTPLLVT